MRSMVKVLVYQAVVHAAWRGLRCTVVRCMTSSTRFRVLQEGVSGDYKVELVGWLLS